MFPGNLLAWAPLFAQNDADAAAATIGIAFLIFFLLIMLVSVAISIVSLVFVIYMLIDCVKNEPKRREDQMVMWLLLIIFLGVIGGLIYYFVRKNEPLVR